MGAPDSPMDVQPGERARMALAVEGLLRMLRIAQDAFPEDDIETVLVLLTVYAGSMALHVRGAEVLRSLDQAPLPDDLFRPISGRAVSASSGLPRESVRRRLEQLTAQGRLMRDERGYRPIAGRLLTPHVIEFARALLREYEAGPDRLGRLETF